MHYRYTLISILNYTHSVSQSLNQSTSQPVIMATFAEAHAQHTPASTGNGTDRVVTTKWTIRYIDSGQASPSFAQCVNEHGNLHMIEELWTLIKAFMVMSDEDTEVCRGMLASHNRDGVVVRGGEHLMNIAPNSLL